MEYQKINKLLDSTSDKVPRFITKKWIEVIVCPKRTVLENGLDLRRQC